MLHRRRHLPGNHPGNLLHHGRPVLLGHHFIPQTGILIVIRRLVAGNRHATRSVNCLHRLAIAQHHRVSVIGDRLQQMLVMLLAFLKRLLGVMPLDRVTDRTPQEMRVDAILHQIILGAFPHGIDRERLVIHPAQHGDRHHRRHPMQRPKRFQAVAVRQGQVSQDHIEPVLAHEQQCLGQPGDRRQFKLRRGNLLEQLAEEACISRVVFDQQNFDGLGFHADPNGSQWRHLTLPRFPAKANAQNSAIWKRTNPGRRGRSPYRPRCGDGNLLKPGNTKGRT
jgi:hypothetical protein